MIVVSDASPLHYLILIGAIDVLPDLFEEIHVPARVMEELQRSRAPDPVKTWVRSPPKWIRVSTPSAALALSIRLDPGEVDAIALAKELDAKLILIDERKGRRVAKEHGLTTVGTLTVLEVAAERNLLELRATLQALRSTSYHITDGHINAALRRDAARKQS